MYLLFCTLLLLPALSSPLCLMPQQENNEHISFAGRGGGLARQCYLLHSSWEEGEIPDAHGWQCWRAILTKPWNSEADFIIRLTCLLDLQLVRKWWGWALQSNLPASPTPYPTPSHPEVIPPYQQWQYWIGLGTWVVDKLLSSRNKLHRRLSSSSLVSMSKTSQSGWEKVGARIAYKG